MSPWPTVSVVLPARDDAAALPEAVGSVLTQDYPGQLELVVAAAPSADETTAVANRLAADEPRVRVVANPDGGTSAGLNAAVRASSGEVVARVDARAELPAQYLRRAVEVLAQTGADNVGGVQQALGTTGFERAVAAAMGSPLGVGGARFHRGGPPGPVETVYLGVFAREALERIGGFDEHLVRNQDYEANWRIRDTGGTVYFHPDLAVAYRPRGELGGLARQYAEYGQWKREVHRRHPRSVRPRQLVAPAVVVANVAGLALAAVSRRWLAVPALYAGAVAAASARTARGLSPGEAIHLPAVFATIHHAWGVGWLAGPSEAGEPVARLSTGSSGVLPWRRAVRRIRGWRSP